MSEQEIQQTQQTERTKGLKHGQFIVLMEKMDGCITSYENVTISPLSQEELADGWSLVMPPRKKNDLNHHFSIYLSQLPPHLWHKLDTFYDKRDHTTKYKTIHDSIYSYSVKMSKSDELIKQLYTEVLRRVPDKKAVSKLYDELLEQRVKGWVMIKAKNIVA